MFGQYPNEQANISGADFAIMCDEMERLRADHASIVAAYEVKVAELEQRCV
jgi:hypothetical protein